MRWRTHILEHWRPRGWNQSALHSAAGGGKTASAIAAALDKVGAQSDRLIFFARVEVLEEARMMNRKVL